MVFQYGFNILRPVFLVTNQERIRRKLAEGLTISGAQVGLVNFENLALEIHATKAGFEVIKPPRYKGTSGVEHRFSFVASDGRHVYAFDLCQDVGEVEVIRAFLKKIDTGTHVSLVCLRGRPSEEGLKLAKSYDLRILTPADIEPFFDPEAIEVATFEEAGSRRFA